MTAFPEVVLVDAMDKSGEMDGGCMGALVAPRLVLTAQHCVDQETSWMVTAPGARRQKAVSRKAIRFEPTTDFGEKYADDEAEIDPANFDIALLVLDTRIALPHYPTLTKRRQPEGTVALAIGRTRSEQGDVDAFLTLREPIRLSEGSKEGFALHYRAKRVSFTGDSGGAIFESGSAPHLIVGVLSGGDDDQDFYTRGELIARWVERHASSHDAGTSPK